MNSQEQLKWKFIRQNQQWIRIESEHFSIVQIKSAIIWDFRGHSLLKVRWNIKSTWKELKYNFHIVFWYHKIRYQLNRRVKWRANERKISLIIIIMFSSDILSWTWFAIFRDLFFLSNLESHMCIYLTFQCVESEHNKKKGS